MDPKPGEPVLPFETAAFDKAMQRDQQGQPGLHVPSQH
jgi:hypothetical protein